ncbi:hypothetical protein AYO44_15880 [Planctomycetaceae bacterium SCGC AG-212-F19]|nr:hypothetical protein AYO44_15880 [Planctomycetaceae bacterium SCGC AG-212-F19]
MFARLLVVILSVLAIGGVEGVRAADPPKADVLPAPKPVPVPMVLGEGQIRCNRYAVWQAYGVDRFGQFRPLVVNTPWGAYYYATGAPFPWATVYPQEFMFKRVD